MHEVRKKVNKTSKPYTEVLSVEVINKYINYDFLESAIDVRSKGQQFIKRKLYQVDSTISGITTFSGIFLCATTGRYCK